MRRPATAFAAPLMIAAALLCGGATAPLRRFTPASAIVSDTNLPESVARFFERPLKVAPHIWALNAPLSSGPAPLANEMVVEQRDGLVLVDAGKTRGAGKRIVALLRAISSKPLKAVIITHWHQDHVLGLGPIVEAWPDVSIITNAATANSIRHDPSYAGAPTQLSQTAARDAARAAALSQYAKDFAAQVHDPKLTPGEHKGYVDLVGVLDQRIADERGTYLVYPTVTFTKRFRIDDPQVPVEAIEAGNGHTDGDLVVWAPRQRVLATGDLVVAPVPYGGSNILEWPATLDRLIALRPVAIVPGHGDILRSTAYLRTMRTAIARIAAKARALPRSPVLSDDEVAARADISAERRMLTHGDAWLGDMFDLSPAADIVQAYHQLTGQK